MTNADDDTDLFESDVLAAAAETHDVDESALAAVVRRHQASVEALPGVEDLAYEWRKRYESPLVERTPDAYYFAVPEWVWEEFGDALGLRKSTLDALRAVHRRTLAARTDAEASPSEGLAYVVLDRNADDTSTGQV